MNIFITDGYDEMAETAVDILIDSIETNRFLKLGLPTGKTPEGVYKLLARAHKNCGVDFSKLTTFNLDEYVGLDINHPQSYNRFMKENLFSKINIPEKNYHLPNGCAKDLEEECLRYEKLIRESGGIDIQLLGIGGNGHIGFNEPSTCFSRGTHKVKLTKETIASNAEKFFDGDIDRVPKEAITMGIKSILDAKKIILIASGIEKAKVIEALVNKPITSRIPATILQRHANVILIIDKAAASLI